LKRYEGREEHRGKYENLHPINDVLQGIVCDSNSVVDGRPHHHSRSVVQFFALLMSSAIPLCGEVQTSNRDP